MTREKRDSISFVLATFGFVCFLLATLMGLLDAKVTDQVALYQAAGSSWLIGWLIHP